MDTFSNMPEENSQLKRKYQPPKTVKPEHQQFILKVGVKLQALRLDKKLTVSGLAKELGISRNAYRMVEEGKVYFNLMSVLQILDYHQLSAEDFFNDL